jgi:hypothetical protein
MAVTVLLHCHGVGAYSGNLTRHQAYEWSEPVLHSHTSFTSIVHV